MTLLNMTPEERVALLEQEVSELRAIISSFVLSDRFMLTKDIQMYDHRNFILSTGVGTKIGTSVNQKIGFFSATPVAQQNSISDPSGGGTQDAQARSAIGSILTALRNLGLIAT